MFWKGPSLLLLAAGAFLGVTFFQGGRFQERPNSRACLNVTPRFPRTSIRPLSQENLTLVWPRTTLSSLYQDMHSKRSKPCPENMDIVRCSLLVVGCWLFVVNKRSDVYFICN